MSMTSSQVRVIDPILSNIAVGYGSQEFVGSVLFPRVFVEQSGGKIIKFGKEAFQMYNSRRSPGAATRRHRIEYSSESYSLVQDALEGVVPREHLRDAAAVPGIDLAINTINSTMRSLTLTLEYDQAVLATTAGNYSSGSRTHDAAGNWGDPTKNPNADIELAREGVRTSIGMYPNTMVVSAEAYAALKINPFVVDRFKYSTSDTVTPAMIAELYDLQQVVVGKAIYFNDAGTAVDVWGDNAVLAYVPPGVSSQMDPSYGFTYTMRGHPMVEAPYYDNTTKSWVYPVTYERVPVITGMASGYLIQDPATT